MAEMQKIAVAGEKDTVLGFKLAGVREAFACDKSNADEVVAKLLGVQELGIIIVSEETMAFLSLKTRRALEASTKPVAVVIPSKTTKTAGGSMGLAAMVKRAIGVDLTK